MNDKILALEKSLRQLVSDNIDKNLIAENYLELSQCYQQEREVEKALEAAEKALEFAKKTDITAYRVKPAQYLAELANKYHHYNISFEQYSWLIDYAKHEKEYELVMAYTLSIANVCWYWGKYAEAKEHYLNCFELAFEQKNEEITGKVLTGLGLVSWKLGDYEESLKHYSKAIKIQKKLQNDSEIARILNYTAIVQKRIGKFEPSMRNFKKALKIQKALDDKESMSKLLNNIGNLHLLQNNQKKALDFYFDSLNLSEELGNLRSIASTRNNVGLIYYRLEKYEDASKFLSKALEIKRKLGSAVDVAHTLNNLGLSYQKLGNYEAADESIQEALNIEEEAGDKAGMAVSYSFLGHSAIQKKEFSAAKEYMQKSREIYELIGDINGITATLINESNIAIEMENYSQAEKFLLESLKIAEDAGIDVHVMNCYNGLSVLYKTKEDYKKAYEYQIKFMDYHDKLTDQENLNKIHEMQAKYKLEQQEKEAEIFRLKNVELHKANKELHDLKEDLERRVKESIDENRKKDSLLVSQSRQAAMGEMIGFIAHQWRQPLNAVGVIAQNILDSYIYDDIDEERLQKDTDNILQQIRFMSDTITDFRNFFKTDKEKVDFKIKDVVMRIVGFIGKSFSNNNIELKVDISDNCWAHGFPNEYAQVILNVLNNAREAFKSCDKKNDKCVEISCSKNDDKHIVSIYDNAMGIEEKDLPYIFDPYYTTKSSNEGTGLGLYMSRTIVEEHMNGSITAENYQGGVRFIIKV